MSGEEECLSDLIQEMKARFNSHGFSANITVNDSGAVETITFVLVRDNTRDTQCQMIT